MAGFGACHHDMSSYEIAAEAYEKALDIDPDHCANKNWDTAYVVKDNSRELYHLEEL